MQQVVVIHGGDSFSTYDDYLAYLKEIEVSLEGGRGWKTGLAEALGPEYQVILPRMPNSLNARYKEWKIWFEKYLPLLNDGVILVGHSLGGSFLAKYLSENECTKAIKGTFLIAAPCTGPVDGSHEFLVSTDLSLLEKQGGELFLYQSTDDEIVPYVEFEKYKAALPNARARSFDDRGHFIAEEFPEIVSDIKSLS